MERNNAWLTYSAQDMEGLERINSSYKACLDEGKTERECVAVARRMAQEKGFKDLKDVIRCGEPLKAGDKVYAVCMDKSILLFHIGRKPLQEGMNILGAHIDSPRIDVKQNPLYENEELYTKSLYDGVGWTEEVMTFLRYNANKALMNLGQDPLFPDSANDVNPIVMNGISTGTSNHDFFSQVGNGYLLGTVEAMQDDDYNYGLK